MAPPLQQEMLKRLSPICFITPDAAYDGLLENTVRAALEAGIRWVQYRRKGVSRRQLFHDAGRLRDLTARFDAMFIVNDYVDIALVVDADGVHIGQDDLPLTETRRIMGNKIIGVSAHTLTEAVEADSGRADYIGFGPIFHTSTKDAGAPKGPGSITAILHAVSAPVIAIGGITGDNVAEVFKSGCRAVAVSSGIFRGEITKNVKNLLYNTNNY
ncbi:MAG TPA: thiamine phosphate synthase [Dissulfurispiraceae bacterium]|nr:thiamine phosphate synthase [Dissulfurispiraceae bacterium]